jgi:hypothetical protein
MRPNFLEVDQILAPTVFAPETIRVCRRPVAALRPAAPPTYGHKQTDSLLLATRGLGPAASVRPDYFRQTSHQPVLTQPAQDWKLNWAPSQPHIFQ